MRGAVFAVALFAAGAGAAAAAIPQPIGPPAVFDDNTATVMVRPGVVSANPTTFTLGLRAPAQCGRPLTRLLKIAFPAAELVPSHIATSAIKVTNMRVRSVTVSGQTVTLALAPPPVKGVLCNSIAPARLSVTFGTAAGLGNPAGAGTYTVTASRGPVTYTAHFQVSS